MTTCRADGSWEVPVRELAKKGAAPDPAAAEPYYFFLGLLAVLLMIGGGAAFIIGWFLATEALGAGMISGAAALAFGCLLWIAREALCSLKRIEISLRPPAPEPPPLPGGNRPSAAAR